MSCLVNENSYLGTGTSTVMSNVYSSTLLQRNKHNGKAIARIK